MNASRAEKGIAYVVLVTAAVVTVLPIIGVLILSFHPTNAKVAGFELPDRLHFETYRTAWDTARFSTYLRSSVIISTAVVVGTVVVSVFAGYAFGTMRFRGDTVLFYVLLAGLIIPFEAIIVPLYFDLRRFHLTNTYWSVILPLIGTNSSFGTYWMRSYFRSVPKELIEAAAIDGAGSMRILLRVLLPGGRPALLTLVVLVFMWSWNEFLLPLVMLSSEELRTAPLGLAFFAGKFANDRVGMAAAAVMVAIPVVTVFVVLQRAFVRGMLAGAVKE